VSTLCKAIIAKQTHSPVTVDGGVLEDDRGGRRTSPGIVDDEVRCSVTRRRQLQVANKGAIRHIAETTSTARGHSLRPSTINLHLSIPSSQRHAAVAVNACSQPFGGVNTQPAPECGEYVRREYRRQSPSMRSLSHEDTAACQ